MMSDKEMKRQARVNQFTMSRRSKMSDIWYVWCIFLYIINQIKKENKNLLRYFTSNNTYKEKQFKMTCSHKTSTKYPTPLRLIWISTYFHSELQKRQNYPNWRFLLITPLVIQVFPQMKNAYFLISPQYQHFRLRRFNKFASLISFLSPKNSSQQGHKIRA